MSESPALTNVKSRRPAWRQRLVEAERGFAAGLRGESTLFSQLFADCIVLAGGAVIGLHLWQWTLLILMLTVVFVTELLAAALQALARESGLPVKSQTKIRSLAIAAGVFASLGGVAITALIFTQRLYEVWPE